MMLAVIVLLWFAMTNGAGALPPGIQPTPPPPATPRPPAPIVIGEPLRVAITGNGASLLVFEWTDVDPSLIDIIVRTTNADENFDPIVEVLNPDGTRLAFNDDQQFSGDLAPLDAAIVGLSRPAPGRYTVRVETFSGRIAGEVEVLIRAHEEPEVGNSDPDAQQTQTGIDATLETIEGSLDAAQSSARFAIEAEAGETLTIRARALDNRLDPEIALYDPLRNLLAENDDYDRTTPDPLLESYDSRIDAFTIPADGVYALIVSGFGGTFGRFELLIERTAAPDIGAIATLTPTPAPDPAYQQIDAEVSADAAYQTTIEALAGDVYTITVEAQNANFDPDLFVYDQAGTAIANSLNHGMSDPALGYYDARVRSLILPTDGVYTIEVYGVEAQTATQTAGAFRLTIERTARGAPLTPPADTYGMGEVAPGDRAVQSFEGRAGDYMLITAQPLTRAFDPRLTLIAPDGTILTDNDDHGTKDESLAFYAARIDWYTLPADGTYTVEIAGFGDSGGAFALTISMLAASPG